MALSDISLDKTDILTCSICLEIFTKPKYLPCLHTFCESCISTYITSGFESGNTESIECPVCRGKVSVPKESCQPKEWADMLPLNFLISDLIDRQKITRAEKMCMLCERFGTESVAKARFVCIQCADTLCDTCEKYHRSIKVSSGHNVKPLDTFSFSDMTLDTFKNTCIDHTGKPLELYCKDHDKPCCSICISINHRKCEKVVTLEDAAKNIASSPRVQNLKRDLHDIAVDVETVLASQKCNLQEFESQFVEAKKNMEKVFKNLRHNLNRQEQLRKTELSKIFDERRGVIEKRITIFESKKKSLENEQKLLEVGVSNASDVQLMIELEKLQTRRDKHKKDLTEESQDLQNFNLSLKNENESIIKKQIEDTCIVQCDTKTYFITLKSVSHKMFEFNRFSTIGTEKTYWKVNSRNKDAISFNVSEMIHLCGLMSYGSRDNDIELEVEASIKKGSDILGELKTSLAGKIFQNHITKIHFERSIALSPDVQYDVVLVMDSKLGLCNYGENAKQEVMCEGVVFKFKKSNEDQNSTDAFRGQIPGFLFRKQ